MKLYLYIATLSNLLPILFFLLFKRKCREKAAWVIFIYVMYTAIHEFISFYLQQIRSELVIYLFSFYTLAEFVIISIYFMLIFKGKIKTTKIIQGILVLFVIYAIGNQFLQSTGSRWDSMAIGVSSLLILIYSLYFLYLKIKRANNLSFYLTFHFWIIATFIVYFSGTFFLNIMAESFRHNMEYQLLYFAISSGFIFLKNVLLAAAMTMKINEKETELSH